MAILEEMKGEAEHDFLFLLCARFARARLLSSFLLRLLGLVTLLGCENSRERERARGIEREKGNWKVNRSGELPNSFLRLDPGLLRLRVCERGDREIEGDGSSKLVRERTEVEKAIAGLDWFFFSVLTWNGQSELAGMAG